MTDSSQNDGTSKRSQFLLEHVDIEINHRCNLLCKHCSARAVRAKAGVDELSVDDLKKILHSAASLGLRNVGLTGGEPLMDKEKLENIARFCLDDLGVPVHTHSNGTLVTVEMCKQGGVLSLFESVSVTFLGGNAESHDSITQVKGSFKRSFEGARIIADAGLPLTCYFIPTNQTCHEFKALAAELHNVGVRRIRAMALAPSGRARTIYDKTIPDIDEMRVFEKDLLQIGAELSIQIEAGNCTRMSMPGLSILAGHERCMSGLNRVHINSRGDVFPCTAASGVSELMLGNLRDSAFDLKEIWFASPLVRNIRALQRKILDGCNECSRIKKCYDTCMVNVIGTMNSAELKACALFR